MLTLTHASTFCASRVILYDWYNGKNMAWGWNQIAAVSPFECAKMNDQLEHV